MAYLKSTLLNEISLMKTSTTIFNSLNPENVYDQVKGTFFIYSYLCPCRFCMHQYLNLSRKFIKIYYSEAYFETSLLKINDNNTIHYVLNNFRLCRGAIKLMENLSKNLVVATTVINFQLRITYIQMIINKK